MARLLLSAARIPALCLVLLAWAAEAPAAQYSFTTVKDRLTMPDGVELARPL
ncbi:MAG: hypothetical protein HY795_15615 [Desulfovibrio sp.]|nr:hypothetical protein [Desulfovibrio sp.]MBI4958751.1 hypothetical protein [Desulfovibrio sp.]